MEFVTRLAGRECAYPLPVHGAAMWRPDPAGTAGCWVATLTLPSVPAEHIIIPSYSQLLPQTHKFRFVLGTGEDVFPLNPVPAGSNPLPPDAPTQTTVFKQGAEMVRETNAVSCHIDCWHTHRPMRSAEIELHLQSPLPPQHYLLTVSIRALEMPAVKPEIADGDLKLRVEEPHSISQMTASRTINKRICSPTALAMGLSCFESGADWATCVEACYDPQTKAYGAWPLAIRTAARYGKLAAVEALAGWDDAVRVLRAGSPLVCSIRFAQGELRDSPMSRTGGHLVVLYGIEGEYVLVKDPAADRDENVPRMYRADEFTRAWLYRRGAAYIFDVDPAAALPGRTEDN